MDPELFVLLWSSSTYKFVEAEEPLVKEEFEEIFMTEPIDDFLTHRMRFGHYECGNTTHHSIIVGFITMPLDSLLIGNST
ncbi:Hypothetical protein FKW44_001936 [Caligus rogercresseyi]|uniref:Uncharacterized protein n=1 Tax=Caligus rogercresseyi TaxID=217165 RepID=A0A7T8KJG9_CALRO|nr:Hypothetical protein FKW44_001936 [Caligus rogercresseyi]